MLWNMLTTCLRKGRESIETCSRVWNKFEQLGIKRGQPETWQSLEDQDLNRIVKRVRKSRGAQAIYSDRVEAIARELLCGNDVEKHSALLLVTFSGKHSYIPNEAVPHSMWHYDSPRLPGDMPAGVIVLGFLNRVEPRGGGTMLIAGSHRLFADSSRGIPSRIAKRRLKKHEYFRDLFDKNGENRDRYLREVGVVNGVELKVVELTGNPGDAYFVNGAVMHTITRNYLDEPRLMVRGFYGTPNLTQYYEDSAREKAKARENG